MDELKLKQQVVRLFINSDYLTVMCIHIQGYTLVTANSVSLTQEKMSEKMLIGKNFLGFLLKTFSMINLDIPKQ